MKYRTIIELICDAANKDEALDVAGEYLRGKMDFGVSMKCNAVDLRKHRIIKYAVTTVTTVVFFSLLLCRFVPVERNEADMRGQNLISFGPTCTVVPALKTETDAGFKKDWEEKQNEAVLDYLKK